MRRFECPDNPMVDVEVHEDCVMSGLVPIPQAVHCVEPAEATELDPQGVQDVDVGVEEYEPAPQVARHWLESVYDPIGGAKHWD